MTIEASFGSLSEAPTPMPIIPERDIRSFSRARIARMARSTAASAGSTDWPRDAKSRDAVQLPPTKLTELPSAAESFESTSPIGLAIVVVLLPAKSSATG